MKKYSKFYITYVIFIYQITAYSFKRIYLRMQGIFDGLPVDHQASVYWNNER